MSGVNEGYINDKITVGVNSFNDANLKAVIRFDFNISCTNITDNKIIINIENTFIPKKQPVLNYYNKKIELYGYEKTINNISTFFYNSSHTNAVKLFGTNSIYPYDSYLVNLTFRVNKKLTTINKSDPFYVYVNPGGWVQQNIHSEIYQINNSTILKLRFTLLRVSSDKTFFQWFYPIFFLFVGFVSILNVKELERKLQIHITLFLALSSTFIYFFPMLPPKSGVNCVIWITLIITFTIMMLFANDVIIYKHNISIYGNYVISLFTGLLIIYISIINYMSYDFFFWVDWYYFSINMITMAICIILPTGFDWYLTNARSSDHDSELLGEEYPQSDRVQAILLIVLLAVWVIDSFILKRYTLKSIPLLVRLSVGLISAGLGIYFVLKSHWLVIDADERRLVDWGVYSVTRHPMYLGSMLFELGVVFTTFSVPALVFLIVIFLVYDRFAAYEENSLIVLLGDEYRDYQRRVRRWGLF